MVPWKESTAFRLETVVAWFVVEKVQGHCETLGATSKTFWDHLKHHWSANQPLEVSPMSAVTITPKQLLEVFETISMDHRRMGQAGLIPDLRQKVALWGRGIPWISVSEQSRVCSYVRVRHLMEQELLSAGDSVLYKVWLKPPFSTEREVLKWKFGTKGMVKSSRHL